MWFHSLIMWVVNSLRMKTVIIWVDKRLEGNWMDAWMHWWRQPPSDGSIVGWSVLDFCLAIGLSSSMILLTCYRSHSWRLSHFTSPLLPFLYCVLLCDHQGILMPLYQINPVIRTLIQFWFTWFSTQFWNISDLDLSVSLKEGSYIM